MKLARALLVAHGLAVAFALLGLLVAIPNPHLWASIPGASSIYQFGMLYAGSVHIVLGAAAMAAFGVAVLGWRRTLVFFGASTILSLSMELLGTGTGWPFGAYEYTAGLGFKVLGRVPFSIPLSWFYQGFASFLLAWAILERFTPRPRTWMAVALGTWLLTAWDLVLDPAMAHADLPIRFWTWHETGPYMGMPLINFAGWSLTGALFMAVSGLPFRGPPDMSRVPAWFPFAVYQLNMLFALALSANVGLWLPIVLALVTGVAPACLAFWTRPTSTEPSPATG